MVRRNSKQVLYVSLSVVMAFAVFGCLSEDGYSPPDPTAQSENLVAGVPGGKGLGKLEYKFNVIGYPADKEYQGGCGEGRRIFVNRDKKGAVIRIVNDDDGWSIADCNATGHNWAELHTNEADVYDIYVKILGKPGGTFYVCADTFEDFTNDERLCLLGTIDLTRKKGKEKFKIQPSSLFDASLEDIVWSVDTNKDFRIVQFRIYKPEPAK